MDKDTLNTASQLIDAILNDLAMPADVTEALRRLAAQILGALAQLNEATAGPTIVEEMTEAGMRGTININGAALMVMRAGVPASVVHDMVRSHLLEQAASEQRLVLALLALTSQVNARRGDLH